MFPRTELKENGKNAFRKNYWSCVGVSLVMIIIAGVTSGNSTPNNNSSSSDGERGLFSATFTLAITAVTAFISLIVILFNIFLGNVLLVGGNGFFVGNRTEEVGAGKLLDGFRSGFYGNIVMVMFLKDLFQWLWTLLFVIPGIIKSYEYRMIPFILAENPNMNYKDAFAISKRMMMGKKLDTFILDLSFIGWWILSVLSIGIVAVFYMGPYVEATNAELYAFNKSEALQEGYIK